MHFLSDRITIGPVSIHYYALIIVTGALLALVLAAKRAKNDGQDPDILWDMFPWLLGAGVVGARLWHIFTPSKSGVEMGITTMYYLAHPLDAINLKSGGLGIPGGVIGGLIALIIYSRIKKLKFLQWADYIVPGLALAQAIGRWGNYINQELYGSPTNLPWKIYIDAAHSNGNSGYYHPLFLYESLFNLANMGALIWINRKFKEKLLAGDLLLLYAIIYPVGRFLLEFLRLDISTVLNFNINQQTMAIIAIGSLITLIIRHIIHSKTPDEIVEMDNN